MKILEGYLCTGAEAGDLGSAGTLEEAELEYWRRQSWNIGGDRAGTEKIQKPFDNAIKGGGIRYVS